MSLMPKDRKSEYEHWCVSEDHALSEMPVPVELVELEKLRQLEELKWLLDDLVGELREVRRQRHHSHLGPL